MKEIRGADFYTMRSRTILGEDDAVRDMLRYDLAFRSAAAPSIIAFPDMQFSRDRMKTKPTPARWSSFGISIAPFVGDDALADLFKCLCEIPESWTTWQTSRVTGDFGKLVPVTLREYVERSRGKKR